MALSLDLAVETPENVVLTHTLAGPAPRLLAYFIDLIFRWMILYAVMLAVFFAVAALPGLATGTLLIVVFLLEWGYTIGFEFFMQGRTPGKFMCKLRVIHENGQPLSWWGATLRNLLRVGDMLPLMLLYGEEIGALIALPVYGPGMVAMLLSPHLQRLGDLAARTVVIREERPGLPRDPAIYEHIQPLSAGEINALRPRSETLSLIDQYLTRRAVLTYQRGHELASGLAQVLAERLDYQGDRAAVEKYPMAFLARVYVTFATDRRQEAETITESEAPSRPRVPAGVGG